MTEFELPAVRVPSSTSNLGAGFDCLGLALDIWLEARLVDGEGPPVYKGTMTGFDPRDDFIARALGEAPLNGCHLEVDSAIPVCNGLGSSAAAFAAGYVLERLHNHQELKRSSIFEVTKHSEGHPDNAGPAVFGGLVLAAGKPRLLEFHQTLGVALSVPKMTMSTAAARVIVPDKFSREYAVTQASRAAALVLGVTTGDGDLIKFGMVDHIAVPARKTLIQGYDAAVAAGTDAGAFGVTISGAGASILAVCEKEKAPEVALAMAEATTAVGNNSEAMWPEVVKSGIEVIRGGDNP